MAQAQEQKARKLTTHQKAVLIQVLRTFPDERVEIRYAPEADDALGYAQDFLAVFKAIRLGCDRTGGRGTWKPFRSRSLGSRCEITGLRGSVAGCPANL